MERRGDAGASPSPALRERVAGAQRRPAPQQQRAHIQRRPQQYEIAVARADIGDDLRVAVAGRDALAHQQSQIVREIGLGILDRLIAADEAAQLLPDRPGPRFQRRVRQHLVRPHRLGG